jgi:tungstate transport system ATP-binding protein
MDEPTSSVDRAARLALESLARDLVHDGVSVLWVTHDLDQMRRVADQVVVVIAGRIAHAAGMSEIIEHAPAEVRDFLGELLT